MCINLVLNGWISWYQPDDTTNNHGRLQYLLTIPIEKINVVKILTVTVCCGTITGTAWDIIGWTAWTCWPGSGINIYDCWAAIIIVYYYYYYCLQRQFATEHLHKNDGTTEFESQKNAYHLWKSCSLFSTIFKKKVSPTPLNWLI